MEKKRICIIADPVTDQQAGIHYYALELCKQLLLQKEFDIHFVLTKKHKIFKRASYTVIPVQRYPGSETIRKALQIPRFLKKHQFDLVHDLSHIAFFKKHASYKQVITIHDLTPILLPHYHVWQGSAIQKRLLPTTLKRADAIITPSKHTASDVQNICQVKHPVLITPLAARVFETIPKSLMPYPYLLYVGTIEPRKGILTLLKAFESLRSSHPDLQLVIVGAKGWKSEEIYEGIRKSMYRDSIHLLGRVSEEDLCSWYQHAKVFVYPSEYEGFGLPPVEAMSLGIPSIVADNSSLRELLPDHYRFETGNSAALSHKINELLCHDETYQRAKQDMLDIASSYSWSSTAHKTREVYRSLLY